MHLSNKVLIELAEKFGTPLYVYNGEQIEERYEDLFKFLSWPKLKVFYAMKANYNPAVLKHLCALGAAIDAVSPGDVRLALACGFSPDRIVYTANNVTDAEMQEVYDLGVLFNIGSLSRLEKFGKAFPGSKVCLRFNPDVAAGGHQKVQTGGDLTKFGILLSSVDQVLDIVNRHNLTVVGLHKHTGSGIKEVDKFLQAVKNLVSIASKERFPNLEFLDFGGGFAVPYHPDEERIDYDSFGKEIVGYFSEFCSDFGKELSLYFEPGKYIIAESGYLVITVNTLKDNKGRRIAGADSGFPQLIRPMFYDAYHHIVNLSNPNGEKGTYDICGNICESGDCFATDRVLSEVREGDRLAIQNAGAYCYAMGGNYNLRPMPAEVIVTSEGARLARTRLSSEELISRVLGEC